MAHHSKELSHYHVINRVPISEIFMIINKTTVNIRKIIGSDRAKGSTMGVHIRHNKDRKAWGKEPKSQGIYLRLLVKQAQASGQTSQPHLQSSGAEGVGHESHQPLSLSRMT